jgi:MFS family permease
MRPSPLLIAFAAFGFVWGGWQAVLPDLARHYGLGTGALGLMLSLGFAVSLPAMLVTGRLVDRLGLGIATAITAGAMVVGLLLVASLPPVPLLVVGVVAFASGSGAYDVAINGAGMGDPVWSRPARLTLLHASFSGGGALGAVAGGGILSSGAPFVWAYVVVAAVLAVAAPLVGRGAPTATAPAGWAPRSVIVALVPLAGLAGIAFLAEGSMETWSAIYLRSVLGAAAFIGALGPAAFHAAMFGGRMVGAGIAAVLGARQTLLVAGGLTLTGMAAALLVPIAPIAIGGMAVAALGASFVVPVVVSVASARAGAHAGSGASVVLTLGYAGFLVGPSLVGMLAEVAGLRVALAVVPVGAAIIVLASRTRLVR